MDSYWITGVNNLQTYGRWAFAEFTDVFDMQEDFAKRVEEEFGKMISATCEAVADLAPTGTAPEGDMQSAIEGMFALRKSATMSDSTLDQRRKEGRK